jgi:hypothetical protein
MTTTQTAPTIAATTTGVVTPARTISIVALVLGIASIVFGQAFFVPLAAIVLGIVGYRQEPAGHSFAVWGAVLGGLALFGWIIVAIVGVVAFAPFLFFAAL